MNGKAGRYVLRSRPASMTAKRTTKTKSATPRGRTPEVGRRSEDHEQQVQRRRVLAHEAPWPDRRKIEEVGGGGDEEGYAQSVDVAGEREAEGRGGADLKRIPQEQ